MKRLMPAAVALLVLVVILPAIADKAKTIYEKGQDAEARENYEAAYDLFKQAFHDGLGARAVERPDQRQGENPLPQPHDRRRQLVIGVRRYSH